MGQTGVTFKIPERYTYHGPRLEGGQGYVYVYKDTFLKRLVAIKEMKHLSNADALRGELAKIREIRSRHVVEVYDLFEAKRSDRVALVQEYVPGLTVEELSIAPAGLSESESVKILWQISVGLGDIHGHSIIHRDVKPSNIKSDGEKILKILDFGLSSIAEPEAETIAARGTTHYLAPEMYDAPPIKFTRKIDVYAFGVTAWYVLNNGKLPKSLRETPPQVWTTPPSFAEANVRLPDRVVAVLDRTLEVKPTDRPSMMTVRDVLYAQLTAGQHRLVITHGGERQVLSKVRPKATLTVGTSFLSISYDEYTFDVTAVGGDVYLNNTKVAVGQTIPESCVITFGAATDGPFRTFVPMMVLSPEVVL